MGLIARMLAGLLMRSGWLLPHGRADWLEGLVAEAAATRAGRGRVAWLVGGVRLLAGELLRRSAIQVLTFIATAGIVVWVIRPGRSSDAAVPVNRIVVPGFLVLLALLALLVRRLYGPIRRGRLPRAARMVGCLVVLATVAGHSVQQREGQKLGAYFGHGIGHIPIAAQAAFFTLVLAGYAAAILILTSRRVRLSRSALPIALATGTLTGVAMYARFGVHLWSGVRGMLVVNLGLGWWGFVALGLPLLTGFAVARVAARGTPANGLESRRTRRLGCRVRDWDRDAIAGGSRRGHDRNLPREGAAPYAAAPAGRWVRIVRSRQSHDPAQAPTPVLDRTQHRRSFQRARRDAHHHTDLRAFRRRSRHRPSPTVTPHR